MSHAQRLLSIDVDGGPAGIRTPDPRLSSCQLRRPTRPECLCVLILARLRAPYVFNTSAGSSALRVVRLSSVGFLERLWRWSDSTRVTHTVPLGVFAECIKAGSADVVLENVKSGRTYLYEVLNRLLPRSDGRRSAPKTIGSYLFAVKGFFRYESLTVDNYRVRMKSHRRAQMALVRYAHNTH
jgi:hypothetical protein